MDKSKIRVVYEYEFRRGTSASQAARNINEVFGGNVANEQTVSDDLKDFDMVILVLTISPVVGLQPRLIMMSSKQWWKRIHLKQCVLYLTDLMLPFLLYCTI